LLQLLFQHRVGNGRDGFHAPVQIALHPVGRTDEKLRIAFVFEAIDATVFQEAAQR